MSKPLRLPTYYPPPNNNTQDVDIHFLEDKFMSCPCCALCAFDVMYFLTRTTARHKSGFPLPPMDGRNPPCRPDLKVIGTVLVIVISSALSFILFQQRCFLGGRVCEISSQRYWNQFHYPPPRPPPSLPQTDWLISCVVTAKKREGTFNYLFDLAL